MERLIIYGIDGPAARIATEAERSGQFAIAAFVREANRGRHLWFVADLQEIQERLTT